MTDRELLELAAKAAGFSITGWNKRNSQHVAVLSDGSYWQPLLENSITDADGDAMRLAVKLGIGIRHHQGWGEVFHPMTGLHEFKHVDCVLEATRRAIVRAAADIGRKM